MGRQGGWIIMTYYRIPFGTPGIATVFNSGFFGPRGAPQPLPDYPISRKENFRRLARRQDPLWVTNSAAEMNMAMLSMVTGIPEADFSSKQRHDYTDWFGVEWTFVPEAGGSMLKPGTQCMDDITEWESKVRFPHLDDWPIRENCEAWLQTCDPEAIIHINIGLGCTERLVSLMGGYTDAMLAMAMEPEAVRAFLESFVDFEILMVEELCRYLPIDFITYHDDWGTERDTFFSEKMMESMVFGPTKRLFSFLHSKDIVVQHHCCGHIARFLPYHIAAGADFLQLQSRANDLVDYKRRFGDAIGFEVPLELPAGDRDGIVRCVRDTVDTYAAGGGLFTSFSSPDPETSWDAAMELYCYSREFYDKERSGHDRCSG